MIETYLECVIQDLSTSPVVSAFNVIRQEWGEEEGYIRIKCHLSNGTRQGTLPIFFINIELTKDGKKQLLKNFHRFDNRCRKTEKAESSELQPFQV